MFDTWPARALIVMSAASSSDAAQSSVVTLEELRVVLSNCCSPESAVNTLTAVRCITVVSVVIGYRCVSFTLLDFLHKPLITAAGLLTAP